MRALTIAIALSLSTLLLPAAQPAFACGAQAAATDQLAAKKKVKKTAKKKEKVEYMRAVPAK